MATDLLTLGRRIRHFRTTAGLTLDQLGAAVATAPVRQRPPGCQTTSRKPERPGVL